MIKVLFICHGNICRSTMAESLFTYMVKKKGAEVLFEIDSAATSREEIGNTPHYGTVGKLREVGIPLVPHRARQMTYDDYDYYDYLIGMDSANIRNMQRIAGGRGDKI
ncbi:MAG: low molecular weight phosphotyrosine protein phosphatase, partial [Clostridiales bacterium]|nr:low molecular weight phosphotyrosine protein phosphatase [Clostridiales bacterium]